MRCNLNGGVRPTGQSAVTNALVSLAVTNRPKLQRISAIAYYYIAFPFSIGRYLPGLSTRRLFYASFEKDARTPYVSRNESSV